MNPERMPMRRGIPQASKHMVERGRELRHEASFPERLLWSRLRNHRLGPRFRRQQPLGPYVVDFLCASARLVVELDGRSHEDQPKYDQERQEYLESQGWKVIRFTNDNLLADLDGVMEMIWATCAAAPSPYPLPKGEE
jgi:very-short-patch-repair endonuclease